MKRARLLEHSGQLWVNLEDLRTTIAYYLTEATGILDVQNNWENPMTEPNLYRLLWAALFTINLVALALVVRAAWRYRRLNRIGTDFIQSLRAKAKARAAQPEEVPLNLATTKQLLAALQDRPGFCGLIIRCHKHRQEKRTTSIQVHSIALDAPEAHYYASCATLLIAKTIEP